MTHAFSASDTKGFERFLSGSKAALTECQKDTKNTKTATKTSSRRHNIVPMVFLQTLHRVAQYLPYRKPIVRHHLLQNRTIIVRHRPYKPHRHMARLLILHTVFLKILRHNTRNKLLKVVIYQFANSLIFNIFRAELRQSRQPSVREWQPIYMLYHRCHIQIILRQKTSP